MPNENKILIVSTSAHGGMLSVIGALTTAGAFLVMGLTHFKGIQEMGIICGGGLLVCLIPMMTMLPVLLLRGRQNVLDHKIGDLERRDLRHRGDPQTQQPALGANRVVQRLPFRPTDSA